MNDGVDHDVEAIAALVYRVRGRNVTAGGDWDYPGIRKAVQAAVQHARDYHRPLEVAAIACLRAAADRRNRTPQVMAMPGPHWHDTAVAETTAPPRGEQQCDRHPGRWQGDHDCDELDGYGPDPVDVHELEQQGLHGRDLVHAVRQQLWPTPTDRQETE